MGRQRHRLQNPHGHVSCLAAVDRMRARTGSRRAFPHLLGHHDAETAYRRATRSQIISAAAGHRHHMRAAGAGRLPRIDQLDQLRHRDRAAKPEPAVRLGGRMPARAATARRTGRHRRGARLRGNRADCDRRRLHHAETAVGRPDLGRYQRGVHGGHGVSSGQAHRTLGQLHRQWHRVPDFRACAAAVRAAVGYGAAVGLAGCGAERSP